jgi:hypothetical protein
LTKKRHDCGFSLLRAGATGRKHRVTEAAGRKNPDGCKESGGLRTTAENLEARQLGAPKFWRTGCFLSPRSLNLYGNEGICGRFGRIGV